MRETRLPDNFTWFCIYIFKALLFTEVCFFILWKEIPICFLYYCNCLFVFLTYTLLVYFFDSFFIICLRIFSFKANFWSKSIILIKIYEWHIIIKYEWYLKYYWVVAVSSLLCIHKSISKSLGSRRKASFCNIIGPYK